jgi:hypothetical protein
MQMAIHVLVLPLDWPPGIVISVTGCFGGPIMGGARSRLRGTYSRMLRTYQSQPPQVIHVHYF